MDYAATCADRVSEEEGKEIQVGVARYIVTEDSQACEFAIVIADDWQHKELGVQLMQSLMSAARAAGIRAMYGEVLAGNPHMLQLTAKLGFRARFDESDARSCASATLRCNRLW